MLRNARWLHNQWKAVYQPNGGVGNLLRCSLGSLRLKYAPSTKLAHRTFIDCTTFSVVPYLTELWVDKLNALIDAEQFRVIIGDCSGGMRKINLANHVLVKPLLNHDHGTKLDWFMRDVCAAKYVLICDDDVFFLNRSPLQWAIAQMETDPNLAVVSFMPRARASKYLLQNNILEPMGSYCLLIRRSIWIMENLSFRVKHTSNEESFHWEYDTTDYAHIMLVNSGYEVAIAPADVRRAIVGFEAVSQWVLRIQKHRGEIKHILDGASDSSLMRRKALAAICAAIGLSKIPVHRDSRMLPVGDLTTMNLLLKAQRIVEAKLPDDDVARIRQSVAQAVSEVA